MGDNNKTGGLSCPLPFQQHPRILLAHGGGGRLTHQLQDSLFQPAFANPYLLEAHDGAILPTPGGKLAYTTDSYVVQPLFFPGGNIGRLAVFGTVNDLAMCGARPLYLSLGCILQEGLPMETLERVVHEIKQAAEEANVQIVTGDTKVVEGPEGGGIFLNTSGIGVCEHPQPLGPKHIQPEDSIIVSGDIGRHGIAVMTQREGLTFDTQLKSDLAPVHNTVMQLLEQGIQVHCLRDLTRGGLGSALHELANTSGTLFHLEEDKVPVRNDVKAACSMLGLDPLFVANEGRFAAIVAKEDKEKCLQLLRELHPDQQPSVVGKVGQPNPKPHLVLHHPFGTQRILQPPSGEQLPRIC